MTATEDTTLRLERDFAASQERVYRAWTEPERMAQWYFPKGFTVPHAESDIRPGGEYRSCLKGPDGTEHWVRGTYSELKPFERIVFTHAWEDSDGKPGNVTTVTLTFQALSPKRTKLTLVQTGLETIASRDGHAEGWSETLDGLETYLR